MKALAVLLGLVTVGLAITVFLLLQRGETAHKESTEKIRQLSDRESTVRTKLEEQASVNLSLDNAQKELKTALEATSNNLAATSANLEKTTAEAKARAEAAALEMAKRDSKIKELEGQNDAKSKEMDGVTKEMDLLEKQITETKRKLNASEGDRVVLVKELKRLQVEKSTLERQFNDLVAVRDQLRKLKEDVAIARRLEWIRDGVYGVLAERGAERLMRGPPVPPTNAPPQLNVEIHQDGGVKIEALPAITNAPAPK
jgi:chromosome segregation ATPase